MEAKRRRWRRGWLLAALGILAVALAVTAVACNVWNKGATTVTSTNQGPAQTAVTKAAIFRDVTKESGIRHTYRNGQEYSLFGIKIDFNFFGIPESNGGGVALIDYDHDGLLDVFIPG